MLIFLDVDGVLIPLRARRMSPWDEDNPLLERVDPADGPRLIGLGGALVWATSWMDDANDVVAPRAGLPRLPVVDFPDFPEMLPGLHWKTIHLTGWAAGRPFVWLDDEITDADVRWVADRHPGPALLRRVDPLAGLSAADLAAAREFSGRL